MSLTSSAITPCHNPSYISFINLNSYILIPFFDLPTSLISFLSFLSEKPPPLQLFTAVINPEPPVTVIKCVAAKPLVPVSWYAYNPFANVAEALEFVYATEEFAVGTPPACALLIQRLQQINSLHAS